VTARFGFPVNLAVRDRRCVIVGGGDEAAVRVRRLQDAGADLVVVSPAPGAALLATLDERVVLHHRPWRPADLEGAAVVIATREDPLDAAELYEHAASQGALVNVLDDVERCDFAAMSMVERGHFRIAIATDGTAPALAKVARRRLESSFDEGWGELAEIVDRARSRLLPRSIPFAEWAHRWEEALSDVDALLARVADGGGAQVQAHLEAAVSGHPVATRRRTARGGRATPRIEPAPDHPVVHLVGAGPGSADLLTIRAARLLEQADVVVHDQLVTPEVLALATDAELVAVGRRQGAVVVRHEEVVATLVEAARGGRRVVRLKGGDPVVFGRGGEEAIELAREGIATELVPGISSAIAAPELAGIPLTHRGTAAGFLVLTGHRATGPGLAGPDARVAGAFDGTVVVLMGGTRLALLCEQLVACGRAPGTAAAVIGSAGRAEQQVVVGDRAALPTHAAAAGVGTPATLVVGEVVQARAAVAAAADGQPMRRTSTAACL
jgi:uroporphyrin-III C-methyltransferase / precorrin-2 dehydrogenase / sirohydrochlorin ferrochelatase